MNKIITSLFFITILSGQYSLNSQSVDVRETLDSINAILKANPYFDGFNEISFFYHADITPDKEIVVEMTFGGPFTWLYKAKISDLSISYKKEACKDSSGSLCWICKTNDSTNATGCVQAEMIMTAGGSEKEYSSSICVSFSSQNMVCNDLNILFDRLFRKVMNNNLKIVNSNGTGNQQLITVNP